MPQVFLLALLGLPFVFFATLAWMRKRRYRALAEVLGARYLASGLFAPGAIAGEGFRIEASQVGKTYRTEVEVSAGATPGPFFLRPAFFQGALNWDFAWVPGVRTERAFFWNVALPGGARPSPEQQDELSGWLPRIPELADLRASLEDVGIKTIVVADGVVSTSFHGIVSDLERIRAIVAALRRLVPPVSPARR